MRRSKAFWFSILMVIFTSAATLAEETEMVLKPDPAVPAAAEKSASIVKDAPQVQRDFYGFGEKQTPPTGKKTLKGSVSDPDSQKKSAQEVYDDIDLPPAQLDDTTGGQSVIPEITQKVKMSSRDQNRIVCSEPIKDVLRSNEKNIKISYFGSSAFVKLQPLSDGVSIVYQTSPVELYGPCGDVIYSLVAVPMKIPTQTIRLGNNKLQKVKDNLTLFREDDTRKKVQELIRRAATDDIPESFTVETLDKKLSLFRDIDITLHRTITVDGEGMTLKEFYLFPKTDGITLTEKQFLRPEITPVPSPMAILPLQPAKGERVRLFVVEFQALTSAAGGNDVQ